MVTPEQRRTVVEYAMESAGLSERQACRYTGFARSSQRYQSTKDDAALGERLQTLAILRPRWGYRRLYRLLRREGLRVNRKRVQRVYREPGCTCASDRGSGWRSSASPSPPSPALTSGGAWISSVMRWPMGGGFGI